MLWLLKRIIQIEPWIDDSELRELKRVIRSTYVVENRLTAEFEHRISKLTGAKYVVAMTNGTAALFCALRATGVGPGDEVIVPDLTFVATSNAVILAGARPVFCDVDSRTFCLDPMSAKSRISRRTKVILPVHLYGQSAEMPEILKLARRNRLQVVEDAAQGVGVRFLGRHVGTFGTAGVLSFYGNKTITCGQGGAVLTDQKKVFEACYRLKNHGRMGKGTFVHEEIGFNFSFTEMQAAVGISQLKKLRRVIQKKRQIRGRYLKGFSQLKPQVEVPFIDSRCEPVFWFSSFLFERVEELAVFLEKKGIQTRRFFYPLHLQPCYQNGSYRRSFGALRSAEQVYRRGLSLPSSATLTLGEQDHVIESILKFYQSRIS